MNRGALWAWVQRLMAEQGTASPLDRWRLTECLCGKLVGDIREQFRMIPSNEPGANREGRRHSKRETARVRRGA